jgi:hypothetical protein
VQLNKSWAARGIIGLMGMTSGCAFEAGAADGGEDEGVLDVGSAEDVGEVSQAAIASPAWLTHYSWNSAWDKGVTKQMISDQQGFCALKNIGGRFRSSSDFVGVWQSGGHFTLSGTTNQGGESVRGSAWCVPISQFTTNWWGYSGVFSGSWTSTAQDFTGAIVLAGWPTTESRCWINGFGGNFGPGGDVFVGTNGAADWQLSLGAGVSNQTLHGRASCVRFVPSNALTTKTVTNTWNQDQGVGPKNKQRKLAKASTHFCFLSSVSMDAPEIWDSTYISYNSADGFYYLTGSNPTGNAQLSSKATCIAYNQL